jgi:NADH-quinone oxidoreductase subunit B
VPVDLPFAGRPASDPPAPPQPEHLRLPDGRTAALYNVSLFNVGLACCAVEVSAAARRQAAGDDLIRLVPYAEGPEAADVLVVSGTITDAMAPAVAQLYRRLAEPRFVVSYGACSNTGGPYWDSYAVTKGVDQILPVDVYVPGCPPRPEALVEALRRLPVRR